MEIWRSQDNLIFTMGFPILLRRHLYSESGLGIWNVIRGCEYGHVQIIWYNEKYARYSSIANCQVTMMFTNHRPYLKKVWSKFLMTSIVFSCTTVEARKWVISRLSIDTGLANSFWQMVAQQLTVYLTRTVFRCIHDEVCVLYKDALLMGEGVA